jgi:GNAT superfamily N-acetyltransferase
MTTDSICIRRATLADISAITVLWAEMMDFHAAREPYFQRSADSAALFADHMATQANSANSALFVAERDGSPVGFCRGVVAERPPVYEERRKGEIWEMAVTASARRQGIGTRLCEAVRRWFVAQGLRRVELHVAVANEVSRPFWRAQGFAPVLESMLWTAKPGE